MDISAGNIITIVSVLVSVGVGWGVLQQKISDHAKKLKEHDDELEITGRAWMELKVQLAEIARDIVYIRERLDKAGR